MDRLTKLSDTCAISGKGSAFFSTFFEPGNPSLGAFHPTNVFRTPFARDRKKTSWYSRGVAKCPPADGLGDRCVAFSVGSEIAEKTGCDLLLTTVLARLPSGAEPKAPCKRRAVVYSVSDSPLCVESASVVWRPPPSERDEVDSMVIQTVRAGETPILERVDRLNEGRGDLWFYRTVSNGFFHLGDLGSAGSTLSHEYFPPSPELEKFCCPAAAIVLGGGAGRLEDADSAADACCDSAHLVELWAEVASAGFADLLALKRASQFSPLPRGLACGMFVTQMVPESFAHASFKEGLSRIDAVLPVVKRATDTEECVAVPVSAIAFCPGGDVSKARLTIEFRAADNFSVKPVDAAPLSLFCPEARVGDEDWCVWHVATAGANVAPFPTVCPETVVVSLELPEPFSGSEGAVSIKAQAVATRSVDFSTTSTPELVMG